MANWREEATTETAPASKPELTKGNFKDLKLATYRPPDKYPNQHSFGVVSQSRDGWANLNLTLDPHWFNPALIAMAMGASKRKDKTTGKETFKQDGKYLQLGQEDHSISAHDVVEADAYIEQTAMDAVEKANVPADQVDTELDKQRANLLIQIKINIGTLWRLQEWAGLEPDETADPADLKGTVFAGSIEEWKGKLRIKTVAGTPNGYTAPERDTEFASASR